MKDPADPQRLLTEACDVVEMIAHEIGAPEACLRRGALERAEARKVSRLLAALEALMRRVLVILAFALMPANTTRRDPAKPAGRPNRNPPPRAAHFIDPQTRFDRQLAALATARFRMLTPQIHPWDGGPPLRFIDEGQAIGRLSPGARDARLSFVRTDNLARRYAAVLRVLMDPEPFAKRLGARLRRIGRPLDYAELSRTAAHLDIDVTVWTRGAPKSRERLWIERHPCRRAHIAASARCVGLAENFWSLKLPRLAGG